VRPTKGVRESAEESRRTDRRERRAQESTGRPLAPRGGPRACCGSTSRRRRAASPRRQNSRGAPSRRGGGGSSVRRRSTGTARRRGVRSSGSASGLVVSRGRDPAVEPWDGEYARSGTIRKQGEWALSAETERRQRRGDTLSATGTAHPIIDQVGSDTPRRAPASGAGNRRGRCSGPALTAGRSPSREKRLRRPSGSQ
jgi:hypothetical protein